MQTWHGQLQSGGACPEAHRKAVAVKSLDLQNLVLRRRRWPGTPVTLKLGMQQAAEQKGKKASLEIQRERESRVQSLTWGHCWEATAIEASQPESTRSTPPLCARATPCCAHGLLQHANGGRFHLRQNGYTALQYYPKGLRISMFIDACENWCGRITCSACRSCKSKSLQPVKFISRTCPQRSKNSHKIKSWNSPPSNLPPRSLATSL